jgi:hypothetical protein
VKPNAVAQQVLDPLSEYEAAHLIDDLYVADTPESVYLADKLFDALVLRTRALRQLDADLAAFEEGT